MCKHHRLPIERFGVFGSSKLIPLAVMGKPPLSTGCLIQDATDYCNCQNSRFSLLSQKHSLVSSPFSVRPSIQMVNAIEPNWPLRMWML